MKKICRESREEEKKNDVTQNEKWKIGCRKIRRA